MWYLGRLRDNVFTSLVHYLILTFIEPHPHATLIHRKCNYYIVLQTNLATIWAGSLSLSDITNETTNQSVFTVRL